MAPSRTTSSRSARSPFSSKAPASAGSPALRSHPPRSSWVTKLSRLLAITSSARQDPLGNQRALLVTQAATTASSVRLAKSARAGVTANVTTRTAPPPAPTRTTRSGGAP